MIRKNNPSKLTEKYVKVPLVGVIFFSLLLVSVSFFAGISFFKLRGSDTTATTTSANTNVLTIKKSDKPELKFFVMSFCPYGNQMETALRPVYDLIGKSAKLQPHYIFSKITNLTDYCNQSAGDPSKCDVYVQNQYFKTVAECQKTIAQNQQTCKNENNYIKAQNGSYYASLHGRMEANQNVREICAYNQLGDDKTQWWNFVANVNKNCTAQNADSCWEDQAKQAGLDTAKITYCFNKDGVSLIDKEIEQTDQYKVSGSPTLIANNTLYPPESAYTQDGKGSIKIGKTVITQEKYRTPNAIKQVICESFNRQPKECKTELADNSGSQNAAAAAGAGCGQ